jgi:prolyl-tRNA synthetase
MTVLELYTGLQYDNNKVEAPSILIDEFNHFANKAINQYVNKRYNLAESKQQLTDDLQGIVKSIYVHSDGKVTDRQGKILDSVRIVKTELGLMFELPCKYLHMLGVVVTR